MFEHRVYPRGESQTPAKFRRACRLVAAALHPEHLEAAHAEAKKQTDVTKWVEDAGMASLRLHGPAPVIPEIWESVNTEAHAQARAAKKAGEEWVPIGERRVAVFTRWARTGDAHLRGLGITRDGTDRSTRPRTTVSPADVTALVVDGRQVEDGSRPRRVSKAREPEPARAARPGPAAKVQLGVIIDLDVVLGARDGPALLEGYGPIPASMARELAADATWRRVFLEPVDGWLLDYGRTRYQPSAKLRDHLLGVGQDCRAPYCNARPKETDHGIDWANLGATSARQHERDVQTHPLPQNRRQLHHHQQPRPVHHLDHPRRQQLHQATRRPPHHRLRRQVRAGKRALAQFEVAHERQVVAGPVEAPYVGRRSARHDPQSRPDEDRVDPTKGVGRGARWCVLTGACIEQTSADQSLPGRLVGRGVHVARKHTQPWPEVRQSREHLGDVAAPFVLAQAEVHRADDQAGHPRHVYLNRGERAAVQPRGIGKSNRHVTSGS